MNRNGKGPLGLGPRTGRGLGKCSSKDDEKKIKAEIVRLSKLLSNNK